MFSLYANVIIGGSVGYSHFTLKVENTSTAIDKIIDDIAILNSPKFFLDGETKGQHRLLGMIHAGYKYEFHQGWLKGYALGMGNTSTTYTSSSFLGGVGLDLGFQMNRFSIFAGGGVAFSWTRYTRFDISKMEGGIEDPKPSSVSSNRSSYVRSFQWFLGGGIEWKAYRNINMVAQYRIFFDPSLIELEKSSYTFDKPAKIKGINTYATSFEPEVKTMAQSILIGVEFNLGDLQ